MNERMKQLAEQAGYTPLQGFDFANELQEVFLNMFAELILQECVNMCNDIADSHLYRNQDIYQRLAPGASYAAKVIKFRFGVEE